MLATIVGQGIFLGLGAAVPIGPVNLEIARRTLRNGFFAGFALGCGASSIDTAYAILSGLSLRAVLNQPTFLQALGIAGGLLLGYLGITSLHSATHSQRMTLDNPRPVGAHTHYFTGLLMTSLNPLTLLFWFVGVPGIVGQITHDPRRNLPFISVGVLIGTVAWVSVFTGLVAFLGQWKNDRWIRVADAAGGLLLIGFAACAFFEVWRRF